VATSGEKASAIADAKLDWHAALDACPPGTRPTGFARWYLRAVSALASYGGLGVKFWALGQRLRIRS
jgi:hypothetical protein